MKWIIPIIVLVLASCNNTENDYKEYLNYIAYGAAAVTFFAVLKPDVQNNTTANSRTNRIFKLSLAIAALFLALLQTHFQSNADKLSKIGDAKKDSVIRVRDDTVLALTQRNERLAHEQLDTSKRILTYSEALNAAYLENISLQEQIRRSGLEQLDTSKTILRYSQRLNEQYAKNSQLQGQLNEYITGDSIVPIIAISKYRATMGFYIANAGKAPLRNIRISYSYFKPPAEHLLPEIEFLPSGATHKLVMVEEGHHPDFISYTFSVTYNNGKFIKVKFYITPTIPQQFWEHLEGKYYDRSGKELKIIYSHEDSLRIPAAPSIYDSWSF